MFLDSFWSLVPVKVLQIWNVCATGFRLKLVRDFDSALFGFGQFSSETRFSPFSAASHFAVTVAFMQVCGLDPGFSS